MSRESRITLRMPFDVAERVAAQANSNGRSMNAEIVARLSNTQANLRDQFAGQQAAAISVYTFEAAREEGKSVHEATALIAKVAYAVADAMLAARKAGDAS